MGGTNIVSKTTIQSKVTYRISIRQNLHQAEIRINSRHDIVTIEQLF